jgi:mRNA interferase RelE/StbE
VHQIRYKKAALKSLASLSVDVRERILASLQRVAEHPDSDALDIKALQGRPGYRLRVGKWRVIYHRDDTELVVLVLEVDARGGVYK